MGRAQADRGVAVLEPREQGCHQRLFRVAVEILDDVDSSGEIPFSLDDRILREVAVGVTIDDGDGYPVISERNL